MSETTDLIGLGLPPEQAKIIGTLTTSSQPLLAVNAAVAAAGTIISDATPLTSVANRCSTGAASSGVRLPAADIGVEIYFRNDSGNTINVWPESASVGINAGANGAAAAITTASVVRFVKATASKWYTF